MAFEIVWTPMASYQLDKLVNYLLKEWGEASVSGFLKRLDRTLFILKQDISKFNPSSKYKQVYKVVITRNNSLVYRRMPYKRQIEIIRIWDHRRHPGKLRF